jgi:tetratricopeptide (TPR) repeat protein
MRRRFGCCALSQERLQDFAGAEASLRAATERWPGDATLQAYLGTLYVRQQRYREAEAPLLRSVELAPASAYALSMLARARQHRCAWASLSELFAKLDEILASEGSEGRVPVEPFAALAMPLSPLAQLHVAQRWAERSRWRRVANHHPSSGQRRVSACGWLSSARISASIPPHSCRWNSGSASTAAGWKCSRIACAGEMMLSPRGSEAPSSISST